MKHILILLLLFGTNDVKVSDLKWPKGLSAVDKRDVLALANRMGITDAATVQFGRVMILGDRYVVVAGRRTETDHERRWSRAYMFRDNWREYEDFPADLRTARVGRWVAKGTREEQRQWRIQDGQWTVNVGISIEGVVEYSIAQQIVLAVRRQSLINAQDLQTAAGVESRPAIPTLDASQIYWIRKADEGFSHLLGHTVSTENLYDVSYSTGEWTGLNLLVRIVSTGVELVGVFSYVI